MANLKNIGVILADTRHAGNIGATARVMKNMGLKELILVNPSSIFHLDAMKFASGSEDIIENVQEFPCLEKALGGFHHSFATTRRARRIRKATITVHEMAEKVAAFPRGSRVGIVFGSEKFGLNNQQVGLCGEMVQIPTVRGFSSINLAQAVGIVCYELFLTSGQAPEPERYIRRPASFKERQIFYEKLEETLEALGFLNTPNPDRLMISFRDLFERARMNEKDVNLLLGLLKEINRAIR